MSITGLNHITFSVAELDRSLRFYCELLGFSIRMRTPSSAYLEAGTLWLALVLDPNVRAGPLPEYSHTALSVASAELPGIVRQLRDAAVTCWQEPERDDSFYFLDPDGHKLELHSGDLRGRLCARAAAQHADTQIYVQPRLGRTNRLQATPVLRRCSLKDGELTFSAVRVLGDNKFDVDYKFTVAGDKLKGKGADTGGDKRQFDIEGTREKNDKQRLRMLNSAFRRREAIWHIEERQGPGLVVSQETSPNQPMQLPERGRESRLFRIRDIRVIRGLIVLAAPRKDKQLPIPV